jgi:hypothetical protein
VLVNQRAIRHFVQVGLSLDGNRLSQQGILEGGQISRHTRVRIRLRISPLTTVRRRAIEIFPLPSSILFIYTLLPCICRLSDASYMFPNI